jgi:Zn ribbon nucleic-acid-binding protein
MMTELRNKLLEDKHINELVDAKDANTLQLLMITGVRCPKCGSVDIMHWGLEACIDAETLEFCGYEYSYECRLSSTCGYAWSVPVPALDEMRIKYFHRYLFEKNFK